ncbi:MULTISPECIES: SDR family NAD(P)-dependent oxidoreductase [Agrobacterium]|nr:MULTISPECIES: 3-oxoacyl-ACP reductase family protein [Agrobacterium]MBN7809209.1 3-oxoacyl-ACP reductase FabG [Agrobacterium rosae]OCJ44938.1 3-oxoacyl-ACP reductase [Agrobacterium rubi]
MQRLEGKRCLVTGAGKGIGRSIALAFAAEGAKIAVLDRDGDLAAETSRDLASVGGGDVFAIADVRDEQAINLAVGDIVAKLGGIDVLVNNAGILSHSPVADMSTSMWSDVIAINLTSAFLCSRAVLPTMIAQKSGRIINMSSQLAHKGGAGLSHYAAAKAGIIGFTKALALEVIGHGINVNALCPGPIDTDMTRANSEEWKAAKMAELPIRRFGRIDEITPTAILLASDEGTYYVGATLNPNGGDVMI